jgi:hypothetical protein
MLNYMNKVEAIQAMKEGKKVTYKYFSPNEWMTMKDGMVVLEDGVKCPPEEFWRYRTNFWWDNGYSLYVE